ncbi:hypothetical protein [Salinigranum sp. GCM10025319]|uniref:hypothetical protein n=1 Tax=Salinigranum sp. GCM10025319 TaxID=3252687 RepID=UPI00360DEAB5
MLTAGAVDRDLRALDRVESAVGRGEYGVPRSVTPVRREKLAALEAVETAREATPAALASGWVAIAVDDVQGGDYTLSRALEYGREGGSGRCRRRGAGGRGVRLGTGACGYDAGGTLTAGRCPRRGHVTRRGLRQSKAPRALSP